MCGGSGGEGDPLPVRGRARRGVGLADRGDLVISDRGVQHVHGQEEVCVAWLEELVGSDAGKAASHGEAGPESQTNRPGWSSMSATRPRGSPWSPRPSRTMARNRCLPRALAAR
ncbi:hypothetical protein SEVIR_2G288100v4 [Setaria viridis]|uniref:Uncharacterized protein n=2 Tax=Setaria TaxID=4554 RepID=A0A368Q3X6_SETIT|nr:hypothetical protein SETIT_2G278100v2 [Setaria italica]TKW34186.1 hypothetical protein SEVIR_2G288100v2 [Setaria viridis]